jgi:MFS superfamily sulfate permease-like transporter
MLHRLVPVSERLPGYGGGALRRDLLAGVTVAALALPAAMAYGELAGLAAQDPDRADLIRSLESKGIIFVFAWVKTPTRHRLEAAGIVELVGPDHLYPTVRAAVQALPGPGQEPG